MQLIRDWESCPASAKNAVVAIGNFDGVHAGHRAVISKAREIAGQQGVKLAVLTFEPHPRMFFKKSIDTIRIQPFRDKIKYLSQIGVDIVYALRFNRKLSETSAEDFIQNFILGALQAKHVVTGDDFVFGKNRTGNSDLLKLYAKKGVIGYDFVSAVEANGLKCSSSQIRDVVAKGDMAAAYKIIGRYYSISGMVIKGDGMLLPK